MGGLAMFMQIVRGLRSYPSIRRLSWLEEGAIAACSYPKTDAELQRLAANGITQLINLHERPHQAGVLAAHGITELHIPVADFTPPTPAQLAQGVAAINAARKSGQRMVIHCGAGLGRTGTLLAAYLVANGLAPADAIARVRTVRPGSIETPEQEAAIYSYQAKP